MNKTQKSQWASDFKEKLSKSQVALFADYKGLSATQADEFRAKLRATKAEVRVLKNNIARQAVKDGALGEETKALLDRTVGPTMVAFGYDDIAATAKAVWEFAKDNDALSLKDGLMDQKTIAREDIEQLASLPSRDALLSMLLSTFNGPARGFVGVLAAVPRDFVGVLAAIKDKKESQG